MNKLSYSPNKNRLQNKKKLNQKTVKFYIKQIALKVLFLLLNNQIITFKLN